MAVDIFISNFPNQHKEFLMKRRNFNKALISSLVTTGMSGSLLTSTFSMASNPKANEMDIKQFIKNIPKAESHVHLQGCITPKLMLKLANRNNIPTRFKTVEEVEKFCGEVGSLADFVTILDTMSSVIRTSDDFYDITLNYLIRSSHQNVKYVEMYFDPQPAIENGLSLEAMLTGMNAARDVGIKEHNIDCKWIMGFNRDRTVESAMAILNMAEQNRDNIVAVGLDNNPTPKYPERFEQVFTRAHELGFKRTSHVDLWEENAIARSWGVLNTLNVDGRIDHGVDALEDDDYQKHLIENNVTLAVCPSLFYNQKPSESVYFQRVVNAVRFALDKGIRITINTDDPGIFAMNYLTETYLLVQEELNLSKEEVYLLAKNSFDTLWIDDSKKAEYLQQLAPFKIV